MEYICPLHKTCKDKKICDHAKPHNPDDLSDDCLTEYCDTIDRKVYCEKIVEFLDDKLFEI